jgi:hypothetical protein
MQTVFNMVAHGLHWLAAATGFTYNEINIIAYYILLPFVYIALLDRILHRHLLKIAYAIAWLAVLCLVKDFSAFSDRLFQRSVDFLRMFSAVGLDYVVASVVICVILPALALAVLLLLAFPNLRRRFFPRTDKRTAG